MHPDWQGFFGYSHQHKEGLLSIKDTDLTLFVVCKEFYFCIRILHVLYLNFFFINSCLYLFKFHKLE